MDKLKMLKSDLKGWNKEVFGYTDKLKLELTNRIHELDSLDDVDNLEHNNIMEMGIKTGGSHCTFLVLNRGSSPIQVGKSSNQKKIIFGN